MTKKNKKYLAIGGAALLLLIIIFIFGKQIGKNENEQRDIDVTVDIKDEHGNVTKYDPNPLLIRLNKGLITTYYFSTSERCKPMEELMALDSIYFMATVKAYKEKYGTSIVVHMRDCYRVCTDGWNNHFSTIEERIETLKDIIK